MAHTRWATHGAPSDRNSHPHDNQAGTIAIVHNGIIENYSSLKAILQKRGYVFKSDTDTEVLAHLIDDMMKTHDKCDLPQAVSLACSQVDGTFGIAVVSSKYPEMLIGARRGSPLIVGVSKGEYFLSSDASAIVDYTSDVIYLEDNDMIVMTRNGGHEIRSLEEEHKDEVLKRKIHHLEISRSEIEKGGHKFFMIKEILDQPRTLQNCMRGRVSIDCKSINLGGLSGEPLQRLLKARRIIVCACGTSWHAGIVGEYLLEHLAGVSVEVEYASEFRYKKPVLFKDEDVVLVISQSGETADTLAAVRARCWSLRHIVLSLSLSLPLLFFFNAYTHTHTHNTGTRGQETGCSHTRYRKCRGIHNRT
ncbi:SIS domain-containing protein [bacterium]|nr:SIS domain-containing protein [bacterium]